MQDDKKVDNESDEPTEPPPFLKEVNESLSIIRRRFEACRGDYNILYKLEKELQKCSTSVTKHLTSSFLPA